MPPTDTLIEAVKQLEHNRAALLSLWKNRPENWKFDYAKARLALQDSMATAFRLFETSLRQQGDAELLARFNALVGDARSKLTQHQARYPVLIIDKQNTPYTASMNEVDKAFDAVMAFIRTNLKR